MKRLIFNVLPLAFSFLFVTGILTTVHAQSDAVYSIDSLESTYVNWYNLSPKMDKIQGVEVNRAYNELLVDKKPKKKIVIAIIDSGVDVNHPDL